MLTIELYGLAEHPKTQLLKVSLLDALVELPLAFSFVQISTIDAFLEQELSEVPCLMVNGGLIPTESTQSVEELSKFLQSVGALPTDLPTTEPTPPHAESHPFSLPEKHPGPLHSRRLIGQETSRSLPRSPEPPRDDTDAGPRAAFG